MFLRIKSAGMRDAAGSCSAARESTGREVCLVNTHLHWRPEDEHVKAMQTWLLLSEVKKLIEKRTISRREDNPDCNTKDIPVILCGDFNSVNSRGAYELCTLGSLSASHPDHPIARDNRLSKRGMLPCKILGLPEMKSDVPLQSSYFKVLGRESEWTNYTENFKGNLDYIFYSPELLLPRAVLPVPAEGDLKKHSTTSAIPNQLFPSDHLPIMATLRFADPPSSTHSEQEKHQRS